LRLCVGAFCWAREPAAEGGVAANRPAGIAPSRLTCSALLLYTCDGIEDKTRQILLLLGARKDAKVRATGCTEGPNQPSRSVWVKLEFDALAPGVAAAGAETVTGVWTPIEITAHRPFAMQEGDCELIEHMRNALTQGFAFKDLDYRTNCVPHQVSLGSYSIKGQVLRAAPAAAAP
jgi:hypothetical protein